MELAYLITAVAALAGAVVALYRRNEQLHDKIERHLSVTLWILLRSTHDDRQGDSDVGGEAPPAQRHSRVE